MIKFRRIYLTIARGTWLLAVAVAVIVLVPTKAHAYIDPLSGSIIIQALAAGLLAFILTAKRFWQRVAGSIRKAFGRAEE